MKENASLRNLSYSDRFSAWERLVRIPWFLLLLLALLAGIGIASLFSAGSGSWFPWALPHLVRALSAFGLAFLVALFPLQFWFRTSYLLYAGALLLLGLTEVFGNTGLGPKRWIDFGVFYLQPSEFMKMALLLALARYYHGLTGPQIRSFWSILLPIALTLMPVFLIYRQPDLGTALGVLLAAGFLCFVAGTAWKILVAGLAGLLALIPILWNVLKEYQKERFLAFLDPERDPLGAGYHILQSKIALGSGGLLGKGYLEGTQTHLNFLPEQHTDFIFTMLAEEWGLMGVLVVLSLFASVFGYILWLSLWIRSTFGRLLILGFGINLFCYVSVNIGMVTGLLPVVGTPLPLISYGGTVLLTVMIYAGLASASWIDRRATLEQSNYSL